MLINFHKKKAQSLIEFLLLVTLVAAAVIIMGPYVIRSWNANMKKWDDSVQDSFTDPVGEVPPTGLEVLACNCQFVPPCDEEPCCGVESCSPFQRSLVWLCDPLECAPEPDPPVDASNNPVNKCQDDLLCCTKLNKRDVPSECGGSCPGFTCPEHQVPAERQCLPGSPIALCECVDDANCANQCESGIPAPTGVPYKGVCQDDSVNLITPTNWTTVLEGGCSKPAGTTPKCQIECNPTFIPDNTQTQCVCPSCQRYIYDNATCQFGYCGDNYCDRCNNAANNPTGYEFPGGETWQTCPQDCPKPCQPQDNGFFQFHQCSCGTLRSAVTFQHGTVKRFDPGFCNCGGCGGSSYTLTCGTSGPFRCRCNDGNWQLHSGGGCVTITCDPGECGSTPYLFSCIEGDVCLIENEIMDTYNNADGEVAKAYYEEGTGKADVYTETDYYKVRLNPLVTKEGVRFVLKELEPEESQIDQMKLMRVLHPEDSEVMIDHQTNTIGVGIRKQYSRMRHCELVGGVDCLKDMADIDEKALEGREGDTFHLEFDLTGLNKEKLYIVINSWGSDPVGWTPPPVETQGGADSVVIHFTIETKDGAETVKLKDIHPRELEDLRTIFIGEFLKDTDSNIFKLSATFTDHHFIDYMGIMEADTQEDFETEEILIKKATHSNGSDVTAALKDKDYAYVHTVRGDELDMVFYPPALPLPEGYQETYVFVSSGYYYALRRDIYPDVDPTDSFKAEVKAYVDELNSYLDREVKSEYSH